MRRARLSTGADWICCSQRSVAQKKRESSETLSRFEPPLMPPAETTGRSHTIGLERFRCGKLFLSPERSSR